MPKFDVTLVEKVYYNVDVEAEDEDDATAKAIELWGQSSNPDNDYCGRGNGVDVYDTRKVE